MVIDSADRRRHLRPGSLVTVGERIWVIDQVQPVAVVLDSRTAEPVATVGWPELPPQGPDNWPSGWQVRPADDGLWVQQAGGPLALVTEDGLRSGHLSGGCTLRAVSAHGAWCLPDPPVQDIAATEGTPPRGRGGLHHLYVAHPDRTTATVLLDAEVHAARSQDGDVHLQVETGRWSRRNLGTPDFWDLEPETAWLRLPANEPLPDQLSLSTHASSPPPGTESAEPDGGRRFGYRWLPRPDQDDPLEGPAASDPGPAAVDWRAGWVGHGRDRHAAVLAHEAGTTIQRHRIDLGPGTAHAAIATRGWLWLAVEGPRRYETYTDPAPTALIRVRADDGTVVTVLAADTVDVTEHCWPLPPEPVDAKDYTSFWRDRLTDLDHFWTRSDGHRTPLAGGLSDSRVDVVGTWPDTALHITFAYAPRPGRRLRRIVPLFDELGRQAPPEYAAIHLMETLDTEDIPGAAAPGADHIDV
ncbi:hypothetical protein [Modestobacter marinus]|uniref:hypothetical protein n=1 Tax=Modestobacter marinus TaxID=477641 RepID=UPI00201B2642|nr:hypothetical protein [Modestobacter marinus]